MQVPRNLTFIKGKYLPQCRELDQQRLWWPPCRWHSLRHEWCFGPRCLEVSLIFNPQDGIPDYWNARWLYYIEGSLTMGLAIFAMIILPDFPANTRWLSE